eukprot:UN19586
MADEEKAAARGGREVGLEAARAAFYVGDIAEHIVAHMHSEGGFLSRDDLANFAAKSERPYKADGVTSKFNLRSMVPGNR